MTGGDVEDNPIFTGALGVYSSMIIHESYARPGRRHCRRRERSPTPSRSIFAGAQAAVFAVGQKEDVEKPNWVEELFDYGNQQRRRWHDRGPEEDGIQLRRLRHLRRFQLYAAAPPGDPSMAHPNPRAWPSTRRRCISASA